MIWRPIRRAQLRWTPTITFSTPGNLSVTYTVQAGDATIDGDEVRASFRIATSAFTHTTASGTLMVAGLGLTSANETNFVWDGACTWGGITMPGGRTQIAVAMAANSTTFLFTASGSGVAPQNIAAADTPSGGTLILRGNLRFRI